MGGESPSAWWSRDTVAVVTGSNKGIGYEITRELAEKGMTVVLTARDPKRGQSAVDALKAAGLQSVFFYPLQVTSKESAASLAKWLKEKFGGIDILVNNAGISTNTITYEDAEAVIQTNYEGVKIVTEALLPLLRPSPAGARIVNVGSRGGLYDRLNSDSLKQYFRDEDKYTFELFDWLAAKYLEDKKAGRVGEEGWIVGPKNREPIYCESKMFMHGYTITLAKSLAKSQPEDHQIFVVGYCPGITATDMVAHAKLGGLKPPAHIVENTPAQGADTGVWLALLPRNEIAPKTGKLFAEREEFPFGWLNPMNL